jgi:formylmethanofuran dehydrogenase subunit C
MVNVSNIGGEISRGAVMVDGSGEKRVTCYMAEASWVLVLGGPARTTVAMEKRAGRPVEQWARMAAVRMCLEGSEE